MNLVERLLAGDPGRPALRYKDRVVTRGELADVAKRLARRLTERVEPGDRVVILAGNQPAFAEAYLATLAAGAVAVPLEPAAPVGELARQIETVRPALALLTPATASAGARAAGATCESVVLDDQLHSELSALEPAAVAERGADDLAALMFTSGTAGMPKAAMLTHGNFEANIEQSEAVPALALERDDVVFGALPFFHVFGLNVVLNRSLAAGVLLEVVDHFDPAATLQRIRDRGVTVLPAVPAMYAAWLALPDAPPHSFATVRVAVSGATALPGDVREAMSERFGLQVHEGYGLTEAAPIVTSAVADGPARDSSVGWPLPGVEVKLVDSAGDDALVGDPGEILVRGANVFSGYWDEPEATARVLAGGWLHTGDVGVANDDGSLRLVDRSKDLIIVSGFNVYPGEVEAALKELPEVTEAAVVGVRDARSGERVEAYVVPARGATIDVVQVCGLLSDRLARYKVPAAVHVVDELPRRWADKLARFELRDRD